MLPLLVSAALHLCVGAPPPAPPHPAPERPASTRGGEPSDRADAGEVPPEHRAQHALFQQKCAKCHALSIATSSRLTEAQLKRHLKRPGVALSPAQARAITDFLKLEAARRPSR